MSGFLTTVDREGEIYLECSECEAAISGDEIGERLGIRWRPDLIPPRYASKDEPLSVRSVDIHPNTILVIRWPEGITEYDRDRIRVMISCMPNPPAFVIHTVGDADLSTLNEEDMRRYGWVRAESTKHADLES